VGFPAIGYDRDFQTNPAYPEQHGDHPGEATMNATNPAVALALLVLAVAVDSSADTILLQEQFNVEPEEWTVADNTYGGWNPQFGNPGGCFILNNAGQPESDPSLARTITGLNVGWQYRLEGDFKNHFNYCPQPSSISFRVDLDGETVYSSINRTQWTRFSYQWTASETEVTIRIRSETDGTDCDAAIDNITLIQISPPCLADVNGSDDVDGVDLAAVLGAWGTSGEGFYNTDITSDGIVDGEDLAFVLSGWGPCP
jgi:hypothetical protein